jgi:hypothetical protein
MQVPSQRLTSTRIGIGSVSLFHSTMVTRGQTRPAHVLKIHTYRAYVWFVTLHHASTSPYTVPPQRNMTTQIYLTDNWRGFDLQVFDFQIIELQKLRIISTHSQILSGPMMASTVCMLLIVWTLDKNNNYVICTTQVYDLKIVLPSQKKSKSPLFAHIYIMLYACLSETSVSAEGTWITSDLLEWEAFSAYSYLVAWMQHRLQGIFLQLSWYVFSTADRI